MSRKYFEQLGQDYIDLGIVGDGTEIRAPYSNLDLFLEFTDRTRQVFGAEVTAPQQDTKLKTPAGRRLKELMANRYTFRRSSYFITCCGSAEPRLLLDLNTAIDPEVVGGRRDEHSPVILTSNNQPVGVLKGTGEKSIYGFRDMPMQGVARGVFSQPFSRLEAPAANHAWRMDIEQLKPSLPIRLGQFVLPTKARKGIWGASLLHDMCLETSHRQILALAGELLSTAHEITLDELRPQDDQMHRQDQEHFE